MTDSYSDCIMPPRSMEIAFLPARFLSALTTRTSVQIHLNVVLSTSLFIAAVIAPGTQALLASIPHLCLFQLLFHLPCPGCGMLRSLFAFAHTDLRMSWSHHPVGPFLALVFLLQVPARLLAIRFDCCERWVNAASPRLSRALLGVLILVWLFRFK